MNFKKNKFSSFFFKHTIHDEIIWTPLKFLWFFVFLIEYSNNIKDISNCVKILDVCVCITKLTLYHKIQIPNSNDYKVKSNI